MNDASIPTTNPNVGMRPKHDRTAWLRGGVHHCLMPPQTPAGKARHIVLLGSPGVGKSTQAELLCERLGTCHLSTGDIFRAAKSCCEKDLSPAMHNALDCMNHGDLVPDETVLNLVGERLRCFNCSGGFLLDGFPRTVAQAKALDQLLDTHDIKLTAVINYELAIELFVSRTSGRRTCTSCKTVYHVSSRPPKIADQCDLCGGKLLLREDDRPEAVKVRMEAYQHSTKPLVEFYRTCGLLVTISAEGTPEEIYQRTKQMALVGD